MITIDLDEYLWKRELVGSAHGGAGIFKFIVSPFITFIFVSCASIYSINRSYFESFWQRAYFLILTRMALKNQSLGPVKVSYQ